MTPEGKLKLRARLISQEGCKLFPYTDITGHLSIGIGRNLVDRGISSNEAFYLLDDDIIYFTDKLNHYLNFFYKMDENRQIALIDMCFNLGVQGFLNFKKMILALEAGDYQRAADEIISSKAAEQNPNRYQSLANIMRTGEI
jgi:lysozyme